MKTLEPKSQPSAARRKRHGTATGYQLKVILAEIYPEIWRRLLVSGNIRLNSLHEILQTAMGWSGSHLYEFVVGEKRYADPAVEDYWDELGYEADCGVRLCEVAPWPGDQFQYLYDLGDKWIHHVTVENIGRLDSAFERAICLGGEGACPPEDCGGTSGYSSFVHAVRDTRHEEHKEMLRWVGHRYNPDAFDKEDVNRRLNGLQRPER